MAAVMLYTSPVHDHLGDGQVDILLMAMCLADCVTRRPRWPRGLLVGLAAAIKLVPGIFIPYLWLTGRRRAAAVAATVFVCGQALAALVAPADARRYWGGLVWQTERTGYTAGYKNQSLRAFLLRVLPGPGRSAAIVVVAALAMGVGLGRAVRADARADALAGATLTGLTAVVVSPVSWIHATVWVLPAIGIIAGRLAHPRRVVAAAAITLAFLGALPYVPNVVHGVPGPAVQVLQSGFGLICAALVCALPGSEPAHACRSDVDTS